MSPGVFVTDVPGTYLSLSSRGGRRGLGREAGKDIGNTLGKDMGNTLALHPPAEERPAGGGAQR